MTLTWRRLELLFQAACVPVTPSWSPCPARALSDSSLGHVSEQGRAGSPAKRPCLSRITIQGYYWDFILAIFEFACLRIGGYTLHDFHYFYLPRVSLRVASRSRGRLLASLSAQTLSTRHRLAISFQISWVVYVVVLPVYHLFSQFSTVLRSCH